MTEETARSIARWTMDAIATAPAEQILLVDRDDRPPDLKLATHLQKVGACVTRIQGKGTAEMLDLPHYATVPEPVLEEILNWFRPWLPSSSSLAAQPPVRRVSRSATLEADEYRERLVRFGPGDRLFGVLTSPRPQMREARRDEKVAPSIVLFNTGFEYHVGPHRLYVPLARYWAARGHHGTSI